MNLLGAIGTLYSKIFKDNVKNTVERSQTRKTDSIGCILKIHLNLNKSKIESFPKRAWILLDLGSEYEENKDILVIIWHILESMLSKISI